MSAKTQRITLSYILLVALLCVMLASYVPTVGIAYAEDKVYSNVLDDLKKDTTFDVSMYPEKAEDYSLSIITIAESEDKELFVYVYQPSGQKKNLRASSINISLKADEDLNPLNYELEFLNSNGVFFKYKVVGLTVPLGDSRRYLIPSILRPYDESLGDKPASGGNTVDEVPFEIAKEFRFSLINGKTTVAVLDIDTIEVTDKFVGFVRYPNGTVFHLGACDSHFVAFNTDKPIDRLCEATVSFEQQSATCITTGIYEGETSFGDVIKPDPVRINEEDPTVKYTGNGLFAGTYEWERIQTVDEFIENTNSYTNVYAGALININIATPIKDELKSEFERMKWVLRFMETPYSTEYCQDMLGQTVVARYLKAHFTLVGSVMILRLKFITDGVLYNLGVVDNKQSGSTDPVNRWDDPDIAVKPTKFAKWSGLAICIVLLIVLIILLAPILPYIFKAVFWIISLPFKAIGAIVKACKKNKDKDKGVEVPLEKKVIEDVKKGNKTKAKRHRSRKNE